MQDWLWVTDDIIHLKNNNCRKLENPTQKVLSFRGSPHYMSPEIYDYKEYDCKVSKLQKDIKVFKHHLRELFQSNTLILYTTRIKLEGLFSYYDDCYMYFYIPYETKKGIYSLYLNISLNNLTNYPFKVIEGR